MWDLPLCFLGQHHFYFDVQSPGIGVNNATVLGSSGLAQRDGEVVMGGGGNIAGKSQSSIVHLSGTTTNEAPTNLFVNGISGITTIARDSDSSSTSPS